MKIVAEYSFNGGREVVAEKYAKLLAEIRTCIKAVNADSHATKVSKEKTMPGRVLFAPRGLNKALSTQFSKRRWTPVRVSCEYPGEFYVNGYKAGGDTRGAFREMDFVKDRLGVEIQLGKYAFMVYNVCAKMTIFKNLGHIDAGVEIVPVKELASNMSTGVSYFEQFAWDLNARGVSNIDIPVLVLGIAP